MERLTIDEAIAHAKEVANRNRYIYENPSESDTREIIPYKRCAEEHEQLAEWLEELKAYKDAEEQGLMLRLPCSDNTTLYVIENNTDACSECDYFVVGHCCADYCCKTGSDVDYPQHSDEPVCEEHYLEVVKFKANLDWIYNNRKKFGETVFLTKEEAEQALADMKGV